MFEDITIMIPTLGRLHKQQTLESLSPLLQERTVLVVDEDEFEDHDMQYFDKCEVHPLPDHIKGIAPVRQWCVDNCDTPYLFLIDDDMVFFKRDDLDIKLSRTDHEELEEMFTNLVSWMEKDLYRLVGVSARQGNNHVEQDFRDVTRQMNFHGIDVEFFRDKGLRFDGSEVMEDFNLLLNMFTRGYPNRVYYQYCWNQLGSGAEGGCSTYRTNDLQRKCALELKEKFPDFVTVVEKKSKSGWQGMETRTDVRIQWKKAFESSQEL